MAEQNKPFILGIDPGNEYSAFCLVSPELKPLAFGKYKNTTYVYCGDFDTFEGRIRSAMIANHCDTDNTIIVIENIESFGMPVSRTVFDTCIYIGELKRHFESLGFKINYVFRHEEKMFICHSTKANDAIVKQALVDRFAPNTSNHGKGTKKKPGFFYGFKADVWQAFAICCTYHCKYLDKDLHLEDLPF